MKNKIVRFTLLVIAGILALEFGGGLKALSGKGPKGENSVLPEYPVEIPTFVEDAMVVPPVKKVHVGAAPTWTQSTQVAMLPEKKNDKGAPFSKIAEVFPQNEQLFHSPHTPVVSPVSEAQGPYLFPGSGTPAFSPGGIAPHSQGGTASTAKGHDQPKNDQPKEDEPKQEFPPENTHVSTDPQDPPLSTIVLPDQTLPEDISDLPGIPEDNPNPSGQTPGEGTVDTPPRAVPEGGLTALLLGMGLSSLVLMKQRNKRLY